MSLSLSDLLKRLMEMSGSDLHITTKSPPQIRVHGHLVPRDLPQMTPAETKQLAYSVMTDAQKHRFEESFELDFSFGLKGLARFRANVFNQRGATSAVFRVIPFEIKSFNQLGLPAVVSKLCGGELVVRWRSLPDISNIRFRRSLNESAIFVQSFPF